MISKALVLLLAGLAGCSSGTVSDGCPRGLVVDGQCLPRDCPDRDCPDQFICLEGRCLEVVCLEVDCDPGSRCAHGTCFPIDCETRPCPGLGEVCVENECLPPSCVGVECPAGQQCAAGRCYPADCQTHVCEGIGEVCVDSECTQASCVGVQCPAGQVCTLGHCFPATCEDIYCADDEVCIDGACHPIDCITDDCLPLTILDEDFAGPVLSRGWSFDSPGDDPVHRLDSQRLELWTPASAPPYYAATHAHRIFEATPRGSGPINLLATFRVDAAPPAAQPSLWAGLAGNGDIKLQVFSAGDGLHVGFGSQTGTIEPGVWYQLTMVLSDGIQVTVSRLPDAAVVLSASAPLDLDPALLSEFILGLSSEDTTLGPVQTSLDDVFIVEEPRTR